jgi:hypothetical protein
MVYTSFVLASGGHTLKMRMNVTCLTADRVDSYSDSSPTSTPAATPSINDDRPRGSCGH